MDVMLCYVNSYSVTYGPISITVHASSTCYDTYAHQFLWSSEFSFRIYRLLGAFYQAPWYDKVKLFL